MSTTSIPPQPMQAGGKVAFAYRCLANADEPVMILRCIDLLVLVIFLEVVELCKYLFVLMMLLHAMLMMIGYVYSNCMLN